MEQESNQEGVVTEETSEAPSTEEKATSSRVEDTAEYRNMQSQKDKEAARAMKAEQAVESMQNQLKELQSNMERQRKEDRQRQIDAEEDPEKQKELKAKFDFDDYVAREKQGINMAWRQVGELITQYNLPTSAIAELQKATNPDHMVDIAKRIAAEQPKVESPTPPAEKSTPVPDSGSSDMGGKRIWTADEVANLSSEQYTKFEKEIEEQQRLGLIK